MKLIDKDALVAEIKRIKKEECPIDTYEGRNKLFYFERFLSFLDTLEVKDVDLTKEVANWKIDHQVYGMDETFYDIAKYFFELGLRVTLQRS